MIMSFAKCYDVAEVVIDEATKQFGSLLTVDKERQQELRECCGMVDMLAERFGGVSCEVEVNDETTDIMVSLVCGEFEIDTIADDFYVLMRKAKRVGFKSYEEEQLQIDFIFDGIWVNHLKQMDNEQ